MDVDKTYKELMLVLFEAEQSMRKERAEIEDLRRAVDMGRTALFKHRQILMNLRGMDADQADIERARIRLAFLEQVHAEDLAELRRLTTN